jgi:hypothetical protein
VGVLAGGGAGRSTLGALLPVLVGAVLPDLIDKGLLAGGLVVGSRGVGHSLLLWAVVAALAWPVVRLRGVTLGGISHLLADCVDDLLAGVFHSGTLLTAWPLWPLPPARVWVGWPSAPLPCSPCWHAVEIVAVLAAAGVAGAAIRAARA